MKISELVNNLSIELQGAGDKEISGVTYDSRKVSKNYLFVALHGTKENGKTYIKDAISRGAAAVLTDDKTIKYDNTVFLTTNDISDMFGKISSRFYDEPSKKMKVFAVTGTNGKTTITYIIEKIFENAGIKLGVVGTIFYRFGALKISAPNTTPQSSDLHELLSKMKSAGAGGVVMEVSSHGLIQNRISGLEIDVAIFTNLTRDHLDYHKTMDEYKKAKFLLFEKFLRESEKEKKYSVINVDDSAGRELTKIAKGTVITYGIKSDADIKATDIEMLKNKTVFNVIIEGKKIKIETKLIGRHNIYNILAAIGCAYVQNIDLEKVADGIKKFETVPGRFETVNVGQPFSVIIDYAHTPDALGNLIQSARYATTPVEANKKNLRNSYLQAIVNGANSHNNGSPRIYSGVSEAKNKKIITVFGCGGDRDRSKRPLMGEIVGRMS
ncbi:MAG: UDP-N-acetylmuramoyl-L-alanyl-D-glutamate--2,6-diaminopimelate ligase, partial [Elusimicrobiota bacterium]|nr:UDP-N-acetylmuramoyl-L-alanyl-D-glutamate--2,6-diaminopimelate ligase [Elusimicrobiota bacterium]